MNTKDIVARQRKLRVHPNDAAGGGMVSSTSAWTSDLWELDVEGASRRPHEGRMRWDDDVPSDINEALKTLAWSMLVSRPGGAPMRTTQASDLSRHLRYLGQWMNWRKHRSFATITATAVQVFRDDLVVYLAQGDGGIADIDVETGTIANYLRPLSYIDEQARHLEDRDIARMPAAPFGPSSAWDVATDLVPFVDGFTPPLPDEVVLPVVREAHRWLDAPARDILRLQSELVDRLNPNRSPSGNWRAVQTMLGTFEFSPHVPGGEPWHPPFDQYLNGPSRRQSRALEEERVPKSGPVIEQAPVELFGTDRVRRLLSHLAAACAIVIRFQTGIRHGEIFSFEPGLDDQGMPLCIEREQSVSGAYEMFFVKGEVSKGEDEPVATRWLLAGRLYDDTTIPDAVRALVTLNRLAEPWRNRATDPAAKASLLVQPGHSGIAHDPNQIRPMAQRVLADLMKEFVADNVDLSGLDASDERLAEYVRTRGRCIQSRQWRKTWANWMIRIDKRLLPAISQQFQHRSVLLTEEAYVGKDAMQLGIVESAAMSRAVRYMRRAMAGEDNVGGGMRKVITSQMDELQTRIAGLSGQAQEYEIRTWLLDRDIRIWSSPHGKCFIGLMPTDARCHEAAATVDWSNQAPSFANRTPQLCSGCPCFAVDEDDLPFWAERYLENKAIWEDAVWRGMEVNYTIANERWQQSGKVLQSLGCDLATISGEVAYATQD